jgi:hypothetical protein
MRKARSKNLGKHRAGRQTKQKCFGKVRYVRNVQTVHGTRARRLRHSQELGNAIVTETRQRREKRLGIQDQATKISLDRKAKRV